MPDEQRTIVPILSKHIGQGKPRSAISCPVAIALKDNPAYNHPNVFTAITVVTHKGNHNRREYRNTYRLQQLIQRFDNNLKIQPGFVILDNDKLTADFTTGPV